MQLRHRLDLPTIAPDDEPSLTQSQDQQLETGLIEICDEVGRMMLRMGQVQEGWMYLQPTGNKSAAAEILRSITVTEENYEDMIAVLLHQGVDVGRGFELMLQHQGTCNSITFFDQAFADQPPEIQRAAAEPLLLHLHGELMESLAADVLRRRPDQAIQADETLDQVMESRPWILAEGGYHLDATHLASVIRISRVVQDPKLQRIAWELTQYGKRLGSQFQYPDDEPFVDFYPAHQTYYGILLGQNVDAGLTYFARKAQNCDPQVVGAAPIEIYVDLLQRIGRHADAIAAVIDLVPEDIPVARVLPTLVQLVKEHGDAEQAMQFCRDRDDPMAFVATKLAVMEAE